MRNCKKLKRFDAFQQPMALFLSRTQITDSSCAALASALDSGALPALEHIYLLSTLASDQAVAVVECMVEETLAAQPC